MQDLWPANITDTTVIDSPLSILREQARLLGEKTKNLVKADVGQGTAENQKFVYHFYIIAPTLNNYHYRLFTIEYGVEIYPLIIYMDESLGTELNATKLANRDTLQAMVNSLASYRSEVPSERYIMTVPSQERFVEALRKILNSNRTRQVIGSILAQVVPDQLQPQLAT